MAVKIPLVIGKDTQIPFSRNVLATSLETIGINLVKSQAIAGKIREILIDKGVKSIKRSELRRMVARQLRKDQGNAIADKYVKFRKIMELKKPLFILLGGSTGSGKNTVSLELAHRLDIMTVITTDVIREIMRSLFSDEILPMIHTSSYLAHKRLWIPLGEGKDQETIAFREQALRVNAGIRGILKRSIEENASLIINGVHILPDVINEKEFKEANVVKTFVYIRDESEHKRRFHIRGLSSEERSADRYISNFETIRKIQGYLVNRARRTGHLCIDNLNSKKSTLKIIDRIIEKFG